jgi:hypothetical protein
MTAWALFGIELISRDAEDVVALDANAVDENLRRLGKLLRTFRSARDRSVKSLAHAGILP